MISEIAINMIYQTMTCHSGKHMIFELDNGWQNLWAPPLTSCGALGKLFVLVILFTPTSPLPTYSLHDELLRAYHLTSLSLLPGGFGQWEARAGDQRMGGETAEVRVSVPSANFLHSLWFCQWLHSTTVQPLEDGLSSLKPSCGSRDIHLFPFSFGSRCVRGNLLQHFPVAIIVCPCPVLHKFPYPSPSLKMVPSELVICFLCQLLHY